MAVGPSAEKPVSRRSRVLGWIRLGLVYVFVGFLILQSKPTPALLAAGALLVGIGEWVRIWAAGHLVKSVRLITSGPYSYTQNPLYLGRLLILTGLGIAARSVAYLNLAALGLGYLVFFLYYMPRKLRVEGARLASLHGADFERYNAIVPILFPTLHRYAGDRAPWSFRRMVGNQELLVSAGLVVVLVALVLRLP